MEVLPSVSFVRTEYSYVMQCLMPCSALARGCVETYDVVLVQELSESYLSYTGLSKQCALWLSVVLRGA